MHYYKFHISDYFSHTSHLDEIEDLVYRRMLDWQYLHEKHLPEDIEEIARITRMRTHSERIATVLREFFKHEEGVGFYSERAFAEINEHHEKSRKARDSASRRWTKNNEKQSLNSAQSEGYAKAMRTHSEGNANHKPITNITSEKSLTDFPAIQKGDLEVANWMFELIRQINPGHKPPNVEKWANTIRLMRERDSRTHQQIRELFSWANSDDFWSKNILSPDKLRKQWDKLVIQHKPKKKRGFVC